MTRDYSREIKDRIQKFLKDDDWNFRVNEDTGVFDFDLNLRGRIRSAHYQIRVYENSYTVHALCPLRAEIDDGKMMANMAAFLCMANYGLRNGNFEMDLRDGEIGFKSYVDSEDMILSDAVIKNSIYIPGAMLDRYSQGIVQILLNDMSAKDAIGLCEGGTAARRGAGPAAEPPEEEEESSGLAESDMAEILRLLGGDEEDDEDDEDSDD